MELITFGAQGRNRFCLGRNRQWSAHDDDRLAGVNLGGAVKCGLVAGALLLGFVMAAIVRRGLHLGAKYAQAGQQTPRKKECKTQSFHPVCH